MDIITITHVTFLLSQLRSSRYLYYWVQRYDLTHKFMLVVCVKLNFQGNKLKQYDSWYSCGICYCST